METGETVALAGVVTPEQEARITEAMAELGTENLTGVLERLGAGFSYGQVRLVRAVRAAAR